MEITTYPLNNIEYSAEDAELFHVTRTSGIYAKNSFDYSATGADNNIVIGKGIGWIKNSEFSGKVIAQKESMSLDMGLPDSVYPRIDAIVIQFDSNKNETNIVAKTGVASSTPVAPTVVQTESVYELHLYHVLREAGSLYITPSNITDLRLNSSYCGLMADSVTNIDTTAIERQVEDLIESLQNEISNVIDGSAYLLRNGSTNMTGNLPMDGHKVTGLGTPTADGDAVPKKYIDNLSASDVGAVPTTRKINGKALRTDIELSASDVGAVPLAGGTMAGPLNMGTNSITYLADPTGSMQAANKRYVDNSVMASVSSASNDYHTAHFAKSGKLVICTLLPKTAGTTALYQEDITIPTGYYPAANTTFTIYTTSGSGGNATVRAYANGILRVLRTEGVSVAESSKTYCWVTA